MMMTGNARYDQVFKVLATCNLVITESTILLPELTMRQWVMGQLIWMKSW